MFAFNIQNFLLLIVLQHIKLATNPVTIHAGVHMILKSVKQPNYKTRIFFRSLIKEICHSFQEKTLPFHAIAVGLISDIMSSTNIVLRLFALQCQGGAIGHIRIQMREILFQCHLHAAQRIIEPCNTRHVKRQKLIDVNALQQPLHRPDGILAIQFIIVAKSIRQTNLHLIYAGCMAKRTIYFHISHRIAINMDRCYGLIAPIDGQQHQKVRLSSGPECISGINLFLIYSQNQNVGKVVIVITIFFAVHNQSHIRLKSAFNAAIAFCKFFLRFVK